VSADPRSARSVTAHAAIEREDWEAASEAAIAESGTAGAPAACSAISTATWPPPMGRCRDVSTDRHAAASRRGPAQLSADGVSQVRKTSREIVSPPDKPSSSVACRSGTKTHGGLQRTGRARSMRRHIRRTVSPGTACATRRDITYGCPNASRDPGYPCLSGQSRDKSGSTGFRRPAGRRPSRAWTGPTCQRTDTRHQRVATSDRTPFTDGKPVRSTETDCGGAYSSQGRGAKSARRASECETLRGLISTARSGSCQVLVPARGRSGKTALLEYLTELA